MVREYLVRCNSKDEVSYEVIRFVQNLKYFSYLF